MTAARDNRFWMLPAATFLVGLVLGGVLLWAGTTGGQDPLLGAEPEATETPTAGPTPGATPTAAVVTVPVSCVEVAQEAETVATLGREVASAVGEFDARRLQELVDEFQQVEPRVRSLLEDCRRNGGLEAVS